MLSILQKVREASFSDNRDSNKIIQLLGLPLKDYNIGGTYYTGYGVFGSLSHHQQKLSWMGGKLTHFMKIGRPGNNILITEGYLFENDQREPKEPKEDIIREKIPEGNITRYENGSFGLFGNFEQNPEQKRIISSLKGKYMKYLPYTENTNRPFRQLALPFFFFDIKLGVTKINCVSEYIKESNEELASFLRRKNVDIMKNGIVPDISGVFPGYPDIILIEHYDFDHFALFLIQNALYFEFSVLINHSRAVKKELDFVDQFCNKTKKEGYLFKNEYFEIVKKEIQNKTNINYLVKYLT